MDGKKPPIFMEFMGAFFISIAVPFMDIKGLVLTLIYLIIGTTAIKLELAVLYRGFKIALPLIILTAILRLVFGVDANSAPLEVTAYSLRLLLMFLLFWILTETIKPGELKDFLIKMGLPTWLVISVFLLLKNVNEGKRVWRGIKTAQTSRGVDIETGNPVAKSWRVRALVVPLITWALLRSNYLSVALEARGLSLEKRPTILNAYKIERTDILGILTAIITITVALKL
jgi:energy-coupling factor transport system permease protein